MRFASCNDHTVTIRENCTGIYRAEVFVTKMNLPENKGCPKPGLWTPRVWMNPRRFNFDNIANSMLALFEVYSCNSECIRNKTGIFRSVTLKKRT